MSYRIERDPLGEMQVPSDAYYGAQTARAVDNFPISGLRAPADLITATILVKKAAAETNLALGRLGSDLARAIVAAADEVLNGRLRDQFGDAVYDRDGTELQTRGLYIDAAPWQGSVFSLKSDF